MKPSSQAPSRTPSRSRAPSRAPSRNPSTRRGARDKSRAPRSSDHGIRRTSPSPHKRDIAPAQSVATTTFTTPRKTPWISTITEPTTFAPTASTTSLPLSKTSTQSSTTHSWKEKLLSHIAMGTSSSNPAVDTTLEVHMLAHMHNALLQALYGAPHGFGERKLLLTMMSAQRGIVISFPVICTFGANSQMLLTAMGIRGKDWVDLYIMVHEEQGIDVKFKHRNEEDDVRGFEGKVTKPSAREIGMPVKFHWKEEEGLGFRQTLRDGVHWVKERLR